MRNDIFGHKVAKTVILMIVMLFLFSGGNLTAQDKYMNVYDIAAIFSIGQGGSPIDLGPATDLHVTFSIPEPYFYISGSWNVSTSPYLGAPTIQTYNGANGVNKVEYTYTGLNIPNPSNVKITTSVKGNVPAGSSTYCANALKGKISWTYSGGSVIRQAMPIHGFIYDDAIFEDNYHRTTYKLFNDDLEADLKVNELVFYQASSWINPDDQWDIYTLADSFYYYMGPTTLSPGETLTVNLENIPNLGSNFIYVAGVMEYQMPYADYDYQILEFRHGHEELKSQVIPTTTSWGLYILIVLLLLSAFIIMRKRKIIHSC